MLLNKLADPADIERPEYRAIWDWCVARVAECLRLGLPVTFSEHYRSWEYAQVVLHSPGWAGARVIDLGTSESILPLLLTEQGAQVTTFDMAHIEQRHRLYEHYYPDGRIKVDTGELHHLPYPDGAFDAAVSVSVIEHLADPQKALAEWARVVKPGGYVGLTFDFSDRPVPPPKSGREFRLADAYELVSWACRAGLHPVGPVDYSNVDLDVPSNRTVQEKYTFASLILRRNT